MPETAMSKFDTDVRPHGLHEWHRDRETLHSFVDSISYLKMRHFVGILFAFMRERTSVEEDAHAWY
jgi:hypothetical protein